MVEYEDFDDSGFEDWEADYELIQKNDIKGLIKLRENYLKKSNDDIYAQIRLAEACLINNEYEKALEYIRKLHMMEPDFEDAQYVILDVLFKQGKDVDDFNWVQKPKVIEIQDAVLIVAEKLQNKRKHKPLYEIYTDLTLSGYFKFSEQMLLDALYSDDRFDVKGDKGTYYECVVKLRKK